MKCGFKWFARLALPSGAAGFSQQECALRAGHQGDHRSNTNVTAPNKEKP